MSSSGLGLDVSIHHRMFEEWRVLAPHFQVPLPALPGSWSRLNSVRRIQILEANGAIDSEHIACFLVTLPCSVGELSP